MVVLTSPKHLPTLEHLNETGLKSNKTQRKSIQSFFRYILNCLQYHIVGLLKKYVKDVKILLGNDTKKAELQVQLLARTKLD
jgi:hypothetical protein